MKAKDAVLKSSINPDNSVHYPTLEEQAEITWPIAKQVGFEIGIEQGKAEGIREVVEFISNLIIGIDGCKFEERLDGDKGLIVLDMNENQWQAQLKKWRIEK